MSNFSCTNGGLRRATRLAICAAALQLLAACANQPENQRLTADPSRQPFEGNYIFTKYLEARAQARALPLYPIVVTMSGGGTSATALAADIIRKLRKFMRDGHSLTDDVILVSGTSGGSFAATAFAFHGDDPEAFDQFYRDFVERSDKTAALAGSLLVPWRWDELVTNRTAQLAKLLDDRLHLNNATFGALSDGPSGVKKPFLILNSTDYGAAFPFVFTQRYFSLICSNLNQYSLALATSAAGAFPFLLSDVELKNLRDAQCPVPPTSLSLTVTGPDRFNQIDWARQERYEYDISNAFDQHAAPPTLRSDVKWIHLFDGGLVDNMGIRSAADLFRDTTIKALVKLVKDQTQNPQQTIPAMLHIMISAHNSSQNKVDFQQGSPAWTSMAPNLVFTPIDTVSDLSAWGIQDYMARLFAVADPHSNVYPQSYMTVQIDFDLLDPLDPVTKKLRDDAATSELLTQLDLTEQSRSAIKKIAEALLLGNPCFQYYVKSTGVTSAMPISTPDVSNYCTVIRPGIPLSPSPLPSFQIRVPPTAE
jgi:Patatin-like phospholipase